MSSISSFSFSSASVQSSWQTTANQRKQDWTNLSQSLQSGDLSGAQAAFADLQKLDPKRFGGSSSSTGAGATNGSSSTIRSSPISNDINALSQALSNKDLSGAQKAFSQLQTDFKAQASSGGGSQVHGHHHHHHDSDGDSGGSSSTSSTGSATSSTAGADSIGTTGSIVSVLG